MDLKDQRVTVMGLGLFGGGVGAARYLARKGAKVTVTDLRSEEVLSDSVRALKGLDITFKLGRHEEADFQNADLIVANPAVSWSSKYLKVAKSEEVPITSEICLFVERCPAPIIGVTCSSGKTTTTSLIGEMLKREDKRTLIGGNIGGSLLDELDELSDDVPVVLELSSFQLERLGNELERSPHIAVATNYAPNHIDVHGSEEAYIDAKKQIIKYQKEEDYMIYNEDDEQVSGWTEGDGKRVVFTVRDRGNVFVRDGEIQHSIVVCDGKVQTIEGQVQTVCPVKKIALRGRHNLANALAATSAAIISGVSEENIADVLQTFKGVPHRLERVAKANGVLYVNDSAATSPDRTQAALRTYDKPIVLIAGGYDKNIAFNDLGVTIAEKVAHLIVMGETGEAIAAATEIAATSKKKPKIHRVENLEEAMNCAIRRAKPGYVVLLSPASASLDQFRNFEERGQRFREWVDKLQRKANKSE